MAETDSPAPPETDLTKEDEYVNPSETAPEQETVAEEPKPEWPPKPPTAETDEEKTLLKRWYVILELIETEKDYVVDLEKVVKGYLPAVYEGGPSVPECLKGSEKFVFGNIEQIYEWHRDTFAPELRLALHEPERIANAFIRYEKKLYMYVKYCENKPKADYLVEQCLDNYFEEKRLEFKHKLNIADLLIKPVQRIMKYQLLIKDVMKQTERAGHDVTRLTKACHVMHIVPKAADEMMQVGRIRGFDGKVTAQGKLLLQESLQFIDADTEKHREKRIFVFEQMVLIADVHEPRKTNYEMAPDYVFFCAIKANKLDIKGEDSNPLRFRLINKDNYQEFICEACDEDVKARCVSVIKQLLDMQGDFLRALQAPISYQKGQGQDTCTVFGENKMQKQKSEDIRSRSSNSFVKQRHTSSPVPGAVEEALKKSKKKKSGIFEGFKQKLGISKKSPDDHTIKSPSEKCSPSPQAHAEGSTIMSSSGDFESRLTAGVIIGELEDLEVTFGSSATFTCVVNDSECAVSWRRGDTAVSNSDKYVIKAHDCAHSLEIRSVSTADTGVYGCHVASTGISFDSTAVLSLSTDGSTVVSSSTLQNTTV